MDSDIPMIAIFKGFKIKKIKFENHKIKTMKLIVYFNTRKKIFFRFYTHLILTIHAPTSSYSHLWMSILLKISVFDEKYYIY